MRRDTSVVLIGRIVPIKDDAHYDEEDDDEPVEFNSLRHGDNVTVSDDRKTVQRVASYNGGIVLSHKPLRPGQLFQVCSVHSSDVNYSITVVHCAPSYVEVYGCFAP